MRITVAIAALILVAPACRSESNQALAPVRPVRLAWGEAPDLGTSWKPTPRVVRGLERIAYTSAARLVLQTEGGPRDFIPGVNLGSTLPGRFPGEQAIRAEDFRRWFPQIASLGLRSIRVYTLMPPHFYRELEAYNLRNPAAPLYLLHGVWIPEERFYETADLFDSEVSYEFKREISDVVDAVHGDLSRPEMPGHAWGEYEADVSPWLLGYALGVEWDPATIFNSDQINADRPRYEGEYFGSTVDASPTERWLAEMLDHTATEQVKWRETMPVTFTNWPTTDPLAHPDEPLAKEDLVGIDANHVRPTTRWPGGYFASYHVYPYYPDFQRYEDELLEFEYWSRADPYAGFLAKLDAHHAGIPLVITEFGVPSSVGKAHVGPLGRDQGGHTEQEAMVVDAELMRMMSDLGLAGGYVFEWTDEWFKFTWNTIEFELPNMRRQLWRNPLTNEENFGLLAMDAGNEAVVVIDGDQAEWENNGSQVIFESRRAVREVRAVKDEAYLYLRILFGRREVWEDAPVALGFDVVPGGNRRLPSRPGRDPHADYSVLFDESDEARALVRASLDPIAVLSGAVHGYVPVRMRDLRPGSGKWNLQRLLINRPSTMPTTGEQLPAELFDVGRLMRGTSDPSDPEFNSRVIWQGSGKVLEMRLPYQMIGFSDPSSKRAFAPLLDGRISTKPVDRVGITVGTAGRVVRTKGYSWDPWNAVSWNERPKAGIQDFADAVADVLGDQ